MEASCKTKPEWEIQKQVDDDWWYWFPIVMGISTREEMEHASYEKIQLLNEVATRKQEILNPVGREIVDG